MKNRTALSFTINDPYTKRYIAMQSRLQGKSRQTVIRTMLIEQAEDAEDYAAAFSVWQRIQSGKSTVVSADEMRRRLGLDD